MEQIILASASPRRIEILKRAGISFTTMIPTVDESHIKEKSIKSTVIRLAYEKALSIRNDIRAGPIILSADTLVCKAGRILGKPADKEDAYRMIKMLSGCWHEVLTGFCVMKDRNEYTCGHEKTRVEFKEISDKDVYAYAETDEPYDKAGGYGIQSKGSLFVKKIEGCYFNVMGLPICRIFSILEKYDITLDKIIKGQKRDGE